jgi:hypothetical protein
VPPVPYLTLRGRNGSARFADYAPYGDGRGGFWVRINFEADAPKGNMPAAPAALVLCVPLRDPGCYDPAALLINLDDTPPEPMPPSAPAEQSGPPPRSAATDTPAPHSATARATPAQPPAARTGETQPASPTGPLPDGLTALALPEAGT